MATATSASDAATSPSVMSTCRRRADHCDPPVSSSDRSLGEPLRLAAVVGHEHERHACRARERALDRRPARPRRAPRWARRAAAPPARARGRAPASPAAARPPTAATRRGRANDGSRPASRTGGSGSTSRPSQPRAEADVVGHAPGQRRGQLRHQPDAPAQLERVELAHVRAVEAHDALVGIGEPVSSRRSVDLPDPDGPSSAVAPDGIDSDTSCEHLPAVACSRMPSSSKMALRRPRARPAAGRAGAGRPARACARRARSGASPRTRR